MIYCSSDINWVIRFLTFINMSKIHFRDSLRSFIKSCKMTWKLCKITYLQFSLEIQVRFASLGVASLWVLLYIKNIHSTSNDSSMIPQLWWEYEKNPFMGTQGILTFSFFSNSALFQDRHFQTSIDRLNMDPEA